MKSIKLSVIVPVFNVSKCLGICVSSVLDQTLSDIEVICVDDGSTDGSKDILSEYARRDERIRLIAQSNRGAGAARNAGIKAANGEYIAFLDADDRYPSRDTLARMYHAAVDNGADICGGSFSEFDGKTVKTDFDGVFADNTFLREGWVDYRDYQYDYAYYRFIYSRGLLVSNGIFFPDHRRYQDPPFMSRAFDAAGRFYALTDVTYRYSTGGRVDWDVRKVNDLLCGIEDELVFSRDRGYEKIHALNYFRLCNDFCPIIVGTALREDDSGRILCKLAEVQSSVDRKMLERSGLFTEDELARSTPFAMLAQKLSRLNVRVKREGWFIDRKIFRAFTWPMRKLGNALRCLKHKKGR